MYGSPSGVAAYCRFLTNSGVFTSSTNPTLANVETWLKQVSVMLDSAMNIQGFITPLKSTEAVEAASLIVEQIVADMSKGANSTGRFFSEKTLNSGVSMWQMIAEDLAAWVETMAPGLEQMGVERGDTNLNAIGYQDEAFPIFQRDGFGNAFTDWKARR
jgi:hypothetical protein